MTIATIVMAVAAVESYRLSKTITKLQEEKREMRADALKTGLESMLVLDEDTFRVLHDNPDSITLFPSSFNKAVLPMPELGDMAEALKNNPQGLSKFMKAVYNANIRFTDILTVMGPVIGGEVSISPEVSEDVQCLAQNALKEIEEAQRACGFKTFSDFQKEWLMQ